MRPLKSYHNSIHPNIAVRKHSSHTRSEPNDLFTYTTGRWLWNSPAQLSARRVSFNVPALQDAACRATGTKKCLSLSKIGEGNYNKAYRLEMENGRHVIAKVPHPNAGPKGLTTASEVATMDFVREVLGVPVPRVLDWSATEEGDVGAEYIIMEEAQDEQLHEVWQDLSLPVKCEIVEQVVEIESKLLSLSFDRLGSIYFNNSGVTECSPAVVTNASQDIVDLVKSRYCIGPITRREFWEKERSKMQHHGPWASAIDYLTSVACREIEWINTYAKSQVPVQRPWQFVSSVQNDPAAHISLLQKYISAIPDMTPKNPDLLSPRLWHPDFHAGNIYIDSSHRISSIIDWQGAWTAPPFLGANPPSLLDYGVDMMMFLPENFKTLDDATKEKVRYQVAQSIMIYRYETSTRKKNPVMFKVLHLPHGSTLKQLEAFANGTWDNTLFPFEECLIRVEREWEAFNTNTTCPYQFTQEELERHNDEIEPFNDSQEFWSRFDGVLTDEGFALNETYEQAVEAVKELKAAGLDGLEGEEREEFEKETHWVTELDERGE